MTEFDKTFEDSYDDTLRIHGDTEWGGSVYFEGSEGGAEVDLSFDTIKAIEIADFIYANVGQTPPPATPTAADTTEAFAELPADPREKWNVAAVLTAQECGLPIKFRYAATDSAPIQERTVQSPTLLRSAKGDLFVNGTDPDRDDDRSFRLDRMKGFVSVAA